MAKIWLISGIWHSDWVKAVSRVSLQFKHLLQLLKLFSNDVEPFSFKNIKGLKDAVFFEVPEVGHDLGKWGMPWLSIHSVHSFQESIGECRCQSSCSSDSVSRSVVSES